jgi:hypothetical protein
MFRTRLALVSAYSSTDHNMTFFLVSSADEVQCSPVPGYKAMLAQCKQAPFAVGGVL